MTFSMEQLEAFAAAAEHGSFSSAARALRKAQSAISTQVSNLEQDLGVMLFDRTGRNAVLTAAGERLLAEARLILDRREHMLGIASGFAGHVEARLAVAIDELYPERALGGLFADFAERFPHVELELLFPMMEDASRRVQAGQADLAVMWRQEELPAELGFHTIGWVPLKLACGRNHPLASGKVDWEELKRHRQILVAARGGASERQRLRIAADVWWVESHWVALQILKQGIGWALIPSHILEDSPVAADLATPALQFDEGDHPVALDLVWHKQRPGGPAARWLRERFVATPLPGKRPI